MPTHDSGVPEQPTPEQKLGNGENPGTPVPQPELPRWATKAKASAPFSEERMAAYIGPRWESTYRRKLSGFFADPAFAVTWNWAAFFVGPLWFMYRKLYLAFLLFLVASQLLGTRLLMGVEKTTLTPEALWSSEGGPAQLIMAGFYFTIHLAAAGTANWLLFRRARTQSLIATIQQIPEDVAISRLSRVGGVSTLPVVLLLILQVAFAIVASNVPR